MDHRLGPEAFAACWLLAARADASCSAGNVTQSLSKDLRQGPAAAPFAARLANEQVH